MKNAAGLLASIFAITGLSTPRITGRSEPIEVQKRMHAAWLADAPRRSALAAEIAEWNSKVKRRNRRHVARNLARGRAE